MQQLIESALKNLDVVDVHYEQILKYISTINVLLTCPDLSRFVQTCPDLSRLVQVINNWVHLFFYEQSIQQISNHLCYQIIEFYMKNILAHRDLPSTN